MLLQIFAAVVIAATSDTTTSAPLAPSAASSAHAASAFGGPPDTLALGWLEREALRANPSLAAMRSAAAEARARARVAGSLEDPMVDITVAPRSFTEPFSGDGEMSGAGGSPASEKVPAYMWSIRQRIPIFGERGLERRSARSDAAASMLDAEAARLNLLYEVRLAFFDLYRLERALETIVEQAALLNQFRRVALARYAAGTEGQVDPLQADTELAMLAHQEAVLQREQRVTRARLNSLLHRDPGLPLPPSPRRLLLPALSDTTRRGLEGRAPWPELRALDARLEAQESRLSLASRRRLPEITVGFERDLFMEMWERRSRVMLGFNLPIGLGRLRAGETEARAALDRARHERVAMGDQVALRLEEARAEYEESLHEIEVLELALVPTSDRSLVAARAAYESGRGGFLALIESARRRADARLALETARTSAARGWAALQRAVAGDVIALVPGPSNEIRGTATDGVAAPGSNRKESQR